MDVLLTRLRIEFRSNSSLFYHHSKLLFPLKDMHYHGGRAKDIDSCKGVVSRRRSQPWLARPPGSRDRVRAEGSLTRGVCLVSGLGRAAAFFEKTPGDSQHFANRCQIRRFRTDFDEPL